jgi:hypothetical protein
MSAPAISVVMSVLNGAPHLPAALDSVLDQAGCDLELLVVDDGSTDDTGRILAERAARDSRVQVLTNPTNLGLTRSLNLALGRARGRYIARQDADDVSRPGRLAAQAAFLDARPAVGVVGCWVESGADPGSPAALWRTPVRPAEIRFELLFGNCLAHPSVMLRSALLRPGPLYDEAVRYAQDFALWHRLAATTGLASLPQALYFRRVHPGMIGVAHAAEQERTVRQVLTARWSALLMRPVAQDEVAALRRQERGEPLTRADVRTAGQLLPRLWRAFQQQEPGLAHEDMTMLRRRHARRLLRLAVRGAGTGSAAAVGAALGALRHDPLAACRALPRPLPRRRAGAVNAAGQ